MTKKFELNSRQYGLRNILLHLPKYIHDRRNRNIFTALRDMSFSVERGERVGLVGHNGCGKTTLLSVIGGVYREFKGEVAVQRQQSGSVVAKWKRSDGHLVFVSKDHRHFA